MNETFGLSTLDDCDKVIGAFEEEHPMRIMAEGAKLILAKQAEEAGAIAKENTQIDKLVAKLIPPQTEKSTRNIHIHYGEVEVEDTSVEATEVDVIVTQAVLDKDNVIVTPAVWEKKLRHPSHKELAWSWSDKTVVSLDKGTTIKAKPSKLAITVYKHNPDGADENMGNFKSGQAFCDSQGISVSGDDAKRVLAREGFYHMPYDGSDFSS